MRIGFISSHPVRDLYRSEGSFIYRCENLAHALNAWGHRCKLMHLRDFKQYLGLDVAVFMRPTDSLAFKVATTLLRKSGCVLIGDVDDLIFDSALSEHFPRVNGDAKLLQEARNAADLVLRALDRLDGVVVSTPALAAHLTSIRPKARVHVVPNVPHHTWRGSPAAHCSQRAVCYFAGTRSHNEDFELVVPALERLLAKHDDLLAVTVGPVATTWSHARFLREPKVDFERYKQKMAGAYLSIAPLVDTPFTRCKSALKILEAGVLNVPTIASPVGEYRRMDVKGVMFADTQNWYDTLDAAVDVDIRRDLAEGLSERILERADPQTAAKSFESFLQSLVAEPKNRRSH